MATAVGPVTTLTECCFESRADQHADSGSSYGGYGYFERLPLRLPRMWRRGHNAPGSVVAAVRRLDAAHWCLFTFRLRRPNHPNGVPRSCSG